MGATSGTYLVTHVDETSAVLRDVDTAQVLTVADPPELSVNDVLEARLEPADDLDVTWRVASLEERRSVAVEVIGLEPTHQVRDVAGTIDAGELERIERAGRGEIHVIRVPTREPRAVAEEIAADPETVARAARMAMVRVELRYDDGGEFVSVRYLPD